LNRHASPPLQLPVEKKWHNARLAPAEAIYGDRARFE
jgi:hypothetical protein